MNILCTGLIFHPAAANRLNKNIYLQCKKNHEWILNTIRLTIKISTPEREGGERGEGGGGERERREREREREVFLLLSVVVTSSVLSDGFV